MAVNQNFKDEEERRENRIVYRYWKCPGKKTDNGERHPVCSGRLYDIDGGIADYCPVCGTALVFVITREPRYSVKYPLSRCAECGKWSISRAVKNDCLGGDRVYAFGSEHCSACACKRCCEGLRASVSDYRKNQIGYLEARRFIFQELEKKVSGAGLKAEEFDAVIDGIKNAPAAEKLSEITVEWEMTEALRRINLRKESA
jgi:hypothetical protein